MKRIYRKLSLLWQDSNSGRSDGLAEPSERRFRFWALLILMIVGPPLVLAIYFGIMFPGLTNADALDFAQIGRNLSSGRGFSTSILRPLALSHGGDPLAQPDMTHGPLFPFLLALAFGALGAKDGVVAAVSGLFYLLTIPVIYLLGARIFSRSVALVVALIFTFNALMLEYAVLGLHITLYIFLASSLLLVMFGLCGALRIGSPESTAGLPRGKVLLAGALTALLYLTDPVFFWLLPVIFGSVLWLARTRRASAGFWFLLPVGLLAGPWMIRNGLLTGNPVFGLRGTELWMHTKGVYPGFQAYRRAAEEVVPSVSLLTAVVQKLLLGAGQIIQAFPQVTASWVLAFLLPSLLFRFSDPAAAALRRIMMLCFAGIFIGTVAFGIQMPLFTALIPTMLVFAVGYLLYLMDQAKMSRASSALATALIVIAVSFPLLSDMTLQDKRLPLAEAAMAETMGETTRPNEVSFSDQPWIPAWFANRPSIWIPESDERIAKLRGQFNTARWLFLTDSVRNFSPSWRLIYDDFRNWNLSYAIAAESKQNPPQLLRITDERLKAPLFRALAGFVSIPPPDTAKAVKPGGLPAVMANYLDMGNKATRVGLNKQATDPDLPIK